MHAVRVVAVHGEDPVLRAAGEALALHHLFPRVQQHGPLGTGPAEAHVAQPPPALRPDDDGPVGQGARVRAAVGDAGGRAVAVVAQLPQQQIKQLVELEAVPAPALLYHLAEQILRFQGGAAALPEDLQVLKGHLLQMGPGQRPQRLRRRGGGPGRVQPG